MAGYGAGLAELSSSLSPSSLSGVLSSRRDFGNRTCIAITSSLFAVALEKLI